MSKVVRLQHFGGKEVLRTEELDVSQPDGGQCAWMLEDVFALVDDPDRDLSFLQGSGRVLSHDRFRRVRRGMRREVSDHFLRQGGLSPSRRGARFRSVFCLQTVRYMLIAPFHETSDNSTARSSR